MQALPYLGRGENVLADTTALVAAAREQQAANRDQAKLFSIDRIIFDAPPQGNFTGL